MRHGDDIARRGVEGNASWLLTASGHRLTYLDPQVADISLFDISQCLSRLCRFTGATSQFYSVAQHSVFVGQLVKQALDDRGRAKTVGYWDQILAALFHDSEEAYINDLASPLKTCMGGRYQWIGSGILRTIYDAFDIDWDYHNAEVKTADRTSIVVERFYFMPEHEDWPKIDVSEMEYRKPRLMEHEEANEVFTDAVHAVLNVRDALLREPVA